MRLATTLAVLALALPSAGCLAAAAAGAGAGYWMYDRNETVYDFETDFDRAWEASLAAVEDFADLPPVLSSYRDETAGEIAGDGYRVHVEKHAGGMTRVRVRVGTFDSAENRRVAGLLMESIETRLGW